MTTSKFNFTSLRVALFAAASLCSINTISAGEVDTFSFCVNTCKSPHCGDNTPNIKSDCKKKCAADWKQVAKLEMSKTSRDFRKETNKETKDGMLYDSKIAKCLDEVKPVKKEPEKEPIKEPVKEPARDLPVKEPGQPTSVGAPGPKKGHTSDELCAAALKQEMRDLVRDQALINNQEHNMEDALKALGDKAH